jgi:hypothetical protein
MSKSSPAACCRLKFTCFLDQDSCNLNGLILISPGLAREGLSPWLREPRNPRHFDLVTGFSVPDARLDLDKSGGEPVIRGPLRPIPEAQAMW